MAEISYRTVASLAEFESLQPQWDGLVRQMRRPSPFMLHGWLSAWWAFHGHERTCRVEIAVDDDRLVGAVPLEIESRRGLRIAHFMGRHHAALGDVLVIREFESQVGSALLDRIRVSGVDYVDLFGVPELSVLRGVLQPNDAVFVERVEAPVLDLTGGWETVYRSKTSTKKRNLHNRRRRQLSEAGELTVTVARSWRELSEALPECFRIHDLRWAGRPDGSEFTTTAGIAFHTAAIRNLAALDVPRILLLRIDGKGVAFHYYFIFERRMYVHRLAFDPALARFSPGQIATLAAIESAGGEGVVSVEFLGGGERYKIELADRLEPLYECIGLPSSIRGRAASWATVQSIGDPALAEALSSVA